MKIACFIPAGETKARYGIVEGNRIKEIAGDPFGARDTTGNEFAMSEVKLTAPFEPRHIIGIGKNFVAEGVEKPPVPDLPIFFFKPLTTVVGPEDIVYVPAGTNEVKFESELAVIIGKAGRNIAPEQTDEYIFGYTVANDLGAFDFFHPEGHWTIGKSFDTFCPLGPVIETEFNYREARIGAAVNGKVMQDSHIERMIMPVDQQIAYISRFMTLAPGDVILTGTPAGADMVREGDEVDCYIEGIGNLRNPIRQA